MNIIKDYEYNTQVIFPLMEFNLKGDDKSTWKYEVST